MIIRKILMILFLVLGLTSFAAGVIWKGGNPGLWLIVSNAPLMILVAFFLYLKSGFFLTVLTPSLIFFGFGPFFVHEFAAAHIFMFFSSVLMLGAASYVITAQILRFRILKLFIRMLAGTVLLAGFLFFRARYTDTEDAREIARVERRLFFE